MAPAMESASDERYWRVWLAKDAFESACSASARLRREAKDDIQNPENSETAGCTPRIIFGGFCLVAAFLFGMGALHRQVGDTVRALLLAHTPPLVLLGLIPIHLYEARKKASQNQSDSRTDAVMPRVLGAFGAPVRLSDSGLWQDGIRLAHWDDFCQVAFDRTEGRFFRLRLARIAGRNPPRTSRGSPESRLIGLIQAFGIANALMTLLVALTLLLPPALTLCAFIFGLMRFGWRIDVWSAFFLLLAYATIPAHKRRKVSIPERWQNESAAFLLAFDGATVEPRDALRFIAARIPGSMNA